MYKYMQGISGHFSAAGNLAGVTARLDSIQALGINYVIYLMPVYALVPIPQLSISYCIQGLQGVATEYGTLTDLRTLVDGAHNRGMAVILPFCRQWVHHRIIMDYLT